MPIQSNKTIDLHTHTTYITSMCDGTNHDLKVIYSNSGYDSAHVVRWCVDCGAVVVDLEFDGRTRPGGIMKMRFPKYRKNDDK